jgi:hypothetical protein
MISSLITLRLKRRSADSIDSLLFTEIYAILFAHLLSAKDMLTLEQTIIKPSFGHIRKPEPEFSLRKRQGKQVSAIDEI